MHSSPCLTGYSSAMSHADVQELRRSTSKIEIELDEDTEKQLNARYPRICATRARDEALVPRTRIQRLTARLAQWGVETNGYVTYPHALGVAQQT